MHKCCHVPCQYYVSPKYQTKSFNLAYLPTAAILSVQTLVEAGANTFDFCWNKVLYALESNGGYGGAYQWFGTDTICEGADPVKTR